MNFAITFFNLEAFINEKFSEHSLEYVAYLMLSCISMIFLWMALTQLGRVINFETKVHLMIQGLNQIGNKTMSWLDNKLGNVEATRTYRQTYRQMRHDNYRDQASKSRLPLRLRRRYSKHTFAMALMLLRMSHAYGSHVAYTTTSAGASEPEPDPDPLGAR